MSLFERAFSFLNCTCCGKSFGYNEKVLSCENRRNRNCFDHEAVCGKCMHDHAESIHVMDKQRYITEFVARRHDIEEKIRDFTNKMETKFFDGSIVMAQVEASKAKSADFAEVAERWKAELLQLRSDFNGSFEPKVAQPKSLSGTSTTSVAVESVLEKEVVAEEPKKLDFPGIDLKRQEEEAKQQQMQAKGLVRMTTLFGQPINPFGQSIRPDDIITQPNLKVVFNAPYDDKQTHHIKMINDGGRRIGWAIKTSKTSNIKRLGVDLPCGVLDPKEGVLVAVSCDAFHFGQEATNNDRIIIEWTNTPDGATKQFRREWFQGVGLVRQKNLYIEYNP